MYRLYRDRVSIATLSLLSGEVEKGVRILHERAEGKQGDVAHWRIRVFYFSLNLLLTSWLNVRSVSWIFQGKHILHSSSRTKEIKLTADNELGSSMIDEGYVALLEYLLKIQPSGYDQVLIWNASISKLWKWRVESFLRDRALQIHYFPWFPHPSTQVKSQVSPWNYKKIASLEPRRPGSNAPFANTVRISTMWKLLNSWWKHLTQRPILSQTVKC